MPHKNRLSGRKAIVVGIGEYRVSADPHSEIITYSLGSCVGLTIFDPVAKVGGMLHALLPSSTHAYDAAEKLSHKYVDTACIALFHAVYSLGGQKSRLQVKLAGGGDFLDEKKMFRIGEKNVAAVEDLLGKNLVKISGRHTGERLSRTMRLQLDTGKVTVEIPGHKPLVL